ncbi:two-component system response regulator [Saccharobesus litoralis]|uniref:Two-component system response regulator n=1 Tax=Saccharobesus litoralis TaxID=2172099 RepID=A0A2S0VLB1_9ALTE|nr:response regulator [Saccharobesus litoralis]AWB64992.1 two-component system response regulator [Saccharobesus litoralis]
MALQTGLLTTRPEKVLIVDDARLMRDFLRNMLLELGFGNFSEAENRKDTLRKFKEEKPDVVFLDIELEEENGLEILAQLKEMDAGANVAIVSAHSTIVNVRKAMDLGAKGFMVKPYKPKKLVATLKNMGVAIV